MVHPKLSIEPFIFLEECNAFLSRLFKERKLGEFRTEASLSPGQKGTLRMYAQYGDDLFCVRYRFNRKLAIHSVGTSRGARWYHRLLSCDIATIPTFKRMNYPAASSGVYIKVVDSLQRSKPRGI